MKYDCSDCIWIGSAETLMCLRAGSYELSALGLLLFLESLYLMRFFLEAGMTDTVIDIWSTVIVLGAVDSI